MSLKMFVLFVISRWRPNRQRRIKDLSREGVRNCAPNFQLHNNLSLKSVKCNVFGAGGAVLAPLSLFKRLAYRMLGGGALSAANKQEIHQKGFCFLLKNIMLQPLQFEVRHL